MFIGLILSLIVTALRIASFALLIYCIMSFVTPHNDLYRKASVYVERVLYPVRIKLWQWFPALRNLAVDLSPLVLWFMIDLALALVNLLRTVF